MSPEAGSTARTVRRLRIALAAVVALGVAVPVWMARRHLRPAWEAAPAPHDYPAAGPGEIPCPAASPPVASARTAAGVGWVVRAPANYDPTRRHPLLVVFAPRGSNRYLSERFVGLTRQATAAGFLVAYADGPPLDEATIAELGSLPGLVARSWCVDPSRIAFTGHSDGGTVATALAVVHPTPGVPAAIAPSAAGFRREDLARYPCPPPLPVMVMHNAGDSLFPGYGREAAGWWAECNACADGPRDAGGGCVRWTGCAGDVETLFCESPGGHLAWPDRNGALLEFLRRARRPGAGGAGDGASHEKMRDRHRSDD